MCVSETSGWHCQGHFGTAKDILFPVNTRRQQMLFQCWPSVVDSGPALNRGWVNVLCLSRCHCKRGGGSVAVAEYLIHDSTQQTQEDVIAQVSLWAMCMKV